MELTANQLPEVTLLEAVISGAYERLGEIQDKDIYSGSFDLEGAVHIITALLSVGSEDLAWDLAKAWGLKNESLVFIQTMLIVWGVEPQAFDIFDEQKDVINEYVGDVVEDGAEED